MEFLIKYCKKEHNIFAGCNTIKLGTLDYYREIDPTFTIADVNEASLEITNEGNPLTLSKKQTERLTNGRWLNAKGGVEKGGNIIKKVKFPNCYIFCTSMPHKDLNKKSFAQSFHSDYDSSYLITNIPLFANCLATLLQNHFKLEDLIENDLKKLEDMPINEFRNISLSLMMKPVSYIDSRKIVLEQKSINHSLEVYDSRRDKILFLKEKKDAFQKEFRFAFVYSHPLIGRLSVRKSPKILKLNIMDNTGKHLGLDA